MYNLLGSSSLTTAPVFPISLNYTLVGANIFDKDFTPTLEPSISATGTTSLSKTLYTTKSSTAVCSAGLSHRIYPDFLVSSSSHAVCTVGFSKELILPDTLDKITMSITDGITSEISHSLVNPH